MPQLPRTRYGYGCNPDRPSSHYPRIFLQVAGLPTKQDRFAAGLPPIWDQGQLGSCTSHGLLRAYMFAATKAGKPVDMLSRLMLYYDERALEQTTETDAGAAIADGVSTLESDGVALETTWPYDIAQYTVKPPNNAYSEAKNFEVLKAAKIEPTPGQIKAVLATGWPVVIGFTCYPGLELPTTASTGMVPLPGPYERPIGGHCVCCNGFYDDSLATIGFDNSWTQNWGNGGTGYLPYGYFTQGLVSDCWAIYNVESGDLPAPTPNPTPPTPQPAPAGKTITVTSEFSIGTLEWFHGTTNTNVPVVGIYRSSTP